MRLKVATQQRSSERTRLSGRMKTPSLLSRSPDHRLQQSIGNSATARLLRAGRIQRKLTISDPGDTYEREADRVADEVMRTPDPAAGVMRRAPVQVQRLCSSCAEEEKLQRQPSQAMNIPAGPSEVSEVESYLSANRSGGRALSVSERSFFEPRFGRDFGSVRVHTDSRGAATARAINAKAYTSGHNIVFASGQYSPTTTAGRRLIAHELTHVGQQGASIIRTQPDDPAGLGRALEPFDVDDWKAELRKQGYTEFHSKSDGFKGWAKSAFPDKRKRPDLIAVNHTDGKVLVGDATSGPWSEADIKPGDRRSLPNELGEEDPYRGSRGGRSKRRHQPQKQPHLSKTIDDGRQAARHLPPKMQDYEVTAQDRYRTTGAKASKPVVVKKKGPPAGTLGARTAASKGASPKGAAAGSGKASTGKPTVKSRVGKVAKPVGRGAKAVGRGLARSLPVLAFLAPLFEVSDALAAFNNAKAQVEQLKRELDAMWAELDKKQADEKPAPPPQKIPATQSVRIYDLFKHRLRERKMDVATSRLGTSYLPISFSSLTDLNKNTNIISSSQYDCAVVLKSGIRGLRQFYNFEGYSAPRDQRWLQNLFGKQVNLIRAVCALAELAKQRRGQQPAAKPDGDEISVQLDLLVGDMSESISATCQGPDSGGNWTCSSDGDIAEMKRLAEAGEPLDYLIVVELSRRAAGGESKYLYSLTLDTPDPSKDEQVDFQEGSIPADACDAGRYPRDSVLAYVLKHFSGGCQ